MTLHKDDLKRVTEFETSENLRAAKRTSLKSHAVMAIAGLAGLGAVMADGIFLKMFALTLGVLVVSRMALKDPAGD